MATAFGFDIGAAPQGAAFALSTPAKSNRRQAVDGWQVEMRAGSTHLCVSGGAPDQTKPLDTIVASAHPVAEEFLDILAVEERNSVLLGSTLRRQHW